MTGEFPPVPRSNGSAARNTVSTKPATSLIHLLMSCATKANHNDFIHSLACFSSGARAWAYSADGFRLDPTVAEWLKRRLPCG